MEEGQPRGSVLKLQSQPPFCYELVRLCDLGSMEQINIRDQVLPNAHLASRRPNIGDF